MSAALFLLAMPNVWNVFKPVPPEYLFGDHVDCPCGDRHAIRCVGDLWREDCDRWFLRTRNTVLVYREAESSPPLDPPMDARWSDETKRMEWVAA